MYIILGCNTSHLTGLSKWLALKQMIDLASKLQYSAKTAPLDATAHAGEKAFKFPYGGVQKQLDSMQYGH